MNTDENAMSKPAVARYRIVVDKGADWRRPFVITDERMGGMACSLPDASGSLKRLTFRNGKSAREWLALCQEVANADR